MTRPTLTNTFTASLLLPAPPSLSPIRPSCPLAELATQLIHTTSRVLRRWENNNWDDDRVIIITVEKKTTNKIRGVLSRLLIRFLEGKIDSRGKTSRFLPPFPWTSATALWLESTDLQLWGGGGEFELWRRIEQPFSSSRMAEWLGDLDFYFLTPDGELLRILQIYEFSVRVKKDSDV